MLSTHTLQSAPEIIIVAYRRDAEQLKKSVAEESRLDWEKSIYFRVTDEYDDQDDLTQEIIDVARRNPSGCRIYFQGKCLEKKRLRKAELISESAPAIKTLFQKIKEGLKATGICWRAHARAEWGKSSIGHASPDAWFDQLASAGHKGIAKSILKALRVITERQMREAFKIRDADLIGTSCVHGFIADGEPGSSSLAIQKVLEHMHAGAACSIDLNKPEIFETLDADVLYLYEDGLWSGVELVDRLEKLGRIDALQASKTRIEFRYCVICDAGLAAGRIAASALQPGKFVISSSENAVNVRFIRKGVDAQYPLVTDRTKEAIRKAIDSSIDPYVFGVEGLWNGNENEAMKVCSVIGEQLVRPFLERKAREKAAAQGCEDGVEQGREPIEIDEQKIARWKLGAERFASTIVFESSVPKPALPMMWLEGTVELDGQKIRWQPLFWDARRIGRSAP